MRTLELLTRAFCAPGSSARCGRSARSPVASEPFEDAQPKPGDTYVCLHSQPQEPSGQVQSSCDPEFLSWFNSLHNRYNKGIIWRLDPDKRMNPPGLRSLTRFPAKERALIWRSFALGVAPRRPQVVVARCWRNETIPTYKRRAKPTGLLGLAGPDRRGTFLSAYGVRLSFRAAADHRTMRRPVSGPRSLQSWMSAIKGPRHGPRCDGAGTANSASTRLSMSRRRGRHEAHASGGDPRRIDDQPQRQMLPWRAALPRKAPKLIHF